MFKRLQRLGTQRRKYQIAVVLKDLEMTPPIPCDVAIVVTRGPHIARSGVVSGSGHFHFPIEAQKKKPIMLNCTLYYDTSKKVYQSKLCKLIVKRVTDNGKNSSTIGEIHVDLANYAADNVAFWDLDVPVEVKASGVRCSLTFTIHSRPLNSNDSSASDDTLSTVEGMDASYLDPDSVADFGNDLYDLNSPDATYDINGKLQPRKTNEKSPASKTSDETANVASSEVGASSKTAKKNEDIDSDSDSSDLEDPDEALAEFSRTYTPARNSKKTVRPKPDTEDEDSLKIPVNQNIRSADDSDSDIEENSMSKSQSKSVSISEERKRQFEEDENEQMKLHEKEQKDQVERENRERKEKQKQEEIALAAAVELESRREREMSEKKKREEKREEDERRKREEMAQNAIFESEKKKKSEKIPVVAAAPANCTKCRETRANASSEIESAYSRLDAIEKKNSDLESKNNQLQDELDELHTVLQKHDEDAKLMLDEVSESHKKKVLELQTELAESEEKLNTLDVQYQSNVQNLQNAYNDYKLRYDEARQVELNSLVKENENLRNRSNEFDQINNLKVKPDEKLMAQVAFYHGQLLDYEDTLMSVKTTYTSSNKLLMNQVQQHEENIAEYKKKEATSTLTNNRLERRVKELEAMLMTEREGRLKIAEHCSMLEVQLNTRIEENERLRLSLIELKNSNDKLKKHIQRMNY